MADGQHRREISFEATQFEYSTIMLTLKNKFNDSGVTLEQKESRIPNRVKLAS